MYVEDEPEAEGDEDEGAYDWNRAMSTKAEALLSHEEMERRGFFNEGGGPLQVSVDELQVLDQQAMLAEVSRLNDLTVIEQMNLRRNEDPMRLAGEAEVISEGEEEKADDEPDDDELPGDDDGRDPNETIP